MRIHTFWSGSGPVERQAELVRIWERTWRARGWIPKIVSESTASLRRRSPLRLHRIGSMVFSSPHLVNFSYRPKQKKCVIRKFGESGWQLADIVFFETEEQALNCGRML